MADIFLSYKREDRAQVAPLSAALEAEGLSVWWDPDLPLGQSYAASITRELKAAKIVMPVWTERSIHSEYVQEEATFGKKRGVLIPVRLEAIDPPIGFGMIQTADLSGWEAGDRSHPEFLNLLEAVRALIEKRQPVWPAAGLASTGQTSRRRLGTVTIAAIAAVILVVGGLYAFRTWLVFEGGPGKIEVAAGPTGEGGISYAADPNVRVEEFTFSPDGKMAASSGTDGVVRILDAATGRETKRFKIFGPQAPRLGDTGPPAPRIAWSKTSQYVTIAVADGGVAIIELASGETKGRFATPGGLVDIALAPDDGSLAALAGDGTVRVYQIDGKLLTQFTTKQDQSVVGIAWCPQSDCLLVWGKEMLEVWDPFKPSLVDTLYGHAGTVRAAAFSLDGQSFASVADDRLVLVWNAKNGQQKLSLAGLEEPPRAIAWSRDSRRIAVETQSGKALVWNATGGEPKIVGPRHGEGRGWVAFTPDGKSVVLGGWPRGPRAAPILD